MSRAMTDLFQPDRDRHTGTGEDIVQTRRNVVRYAIDTINITVGGANFDMTPSLPNGKPTVDVTVAAQVGEGFMPKHFINTRIVENSVNTHTPAAPPILEGDEGLNKTHLQPLPPEGDSAYTRTPTDSPHNEFSQTSTEDIRKIREDIRNIHAEGQGGN